ncbi:TrmB family transcriptional regulator [Propionispora hippei]|uniref:TrmB family transcriptional regulator n=1 Tax=Propionispora hippei TaxID=209080 RepID=UPI00122CC0F8|nr:helix-turn-helix domain-containing protein [Propionispora hippei]
MERIYDELQKLGFSKYECKAYVALLQASPITGYEISKRSGVPRSMIYEVLGKLTERGAILIVPSDPVKYEPLSVKEMVGRLRHDMDETLKYVENTLGTLKGPNELNVIAHISGRESVLNEIIHLINQTEKEAWISVWESQLPLIKPHIQKAIERGIRVFSVLFGGEGQTVGRTFHHNYMPPSVVSKRLGGCLTTIVRDQHEVIIANFMETVVPWGVKTTDPALVLIATEYIRHDIMIEEVTREFGADKLDALWRNDADLTHVITGERFK